MSPTIIVPTPDSEAVRKLLTALRTDKTPIGVRVIATSHRAKEGYCYQNVSEKVNRVGGRMQLGWAVWQHQNLFIEAEPHAVFDPGKGQAWIDPTPNSFPDGSPCEEILFIPSNDDATHDPKDMTVPDNVRVPLKNDPRLMEALKLSSERTALLNSVPREWEPEGVMYHYSRAQMERKMQLELRNASLLSAASQT